MARLASHDVIHAGPMHPVLPAGEPGVMLCLAGVPLIWTALVGGMLSGGVETFRVMVALAVLGGVAACVVRLNWLRRQKLR